MSSFWKDKPLEKVIRYQIDYHQIKQERVKPSKRLEIQEANDQFFVRNVSNAMSYAKISFVTSIGFLILFYLISLMGIKGGFPLKGYLGITPFLLVSLIFLIMHYMAPIKEIVLDRLHGKITYPRLFGNSEHRTIQFDSLHVYAAMTTSGDMAVTGKKIRIKDRKYSYTWDLDSSYPEEYWSFMVWYMDKNRPLPPGTAFDEYRQQDFERRKEEGFPRPLYPSDIPTPEATPEQQKERERFWKEW
ncbi:hypothetical protein ACSTS3_14120 [Aquimarina muelleri]|uniref:hypothetical protein n=1 Tax=Aquimarina muelleri TaxID=279356 RepID=UPI003F6855E6